VSKTTRISSYRRTRPVPKDSGRATARAQQRPSRPAAGAAALAFAFIAITIWWLTQDARVQMADPAVHYKWAFVAYDYLHSGYFIGPFKEWTAYPPLVHVIGGVTMLVTGKTIWSPVVTQNLIFVPLLGAGCYQTGRLVYDDARAGLLAVVFALGTPMIIGQFHWFLLDAPEAALVAVSVWLLLSTRRFELLERSFLAGIVVGLGLLTKETFPAFVLGPLLVLLIRGGWRNWRGLLIFAATAACLAGPWYLAHYHDLRGHLGDAGIVNGQALASDVTTASPGWYVWTAIHYQVLAPLVAFAAIGIALGLAQLARRRLRHPLVIELLAGGFVSWQALTIALPPTPRYSLPALVYFAVLGTGWILALPRPGRVAVQGLLVLIAIANVLGAGTGLGHRVTVALPGAAPQDSYLRARRISLFTDDGFVIGAPERSGDVLNVMRQLKRRGVRRVSWTSSATQELAFNDVGLLLFSWIARVVPVPPPKSPPPDMATLQQRPIEQGQRPCLRLWDGTGVWVRLGDPYARHPVDGCPAHARG
jgi:4-amino-4-deoxy-L-arabinose transferase-like glycosyltransferase